MRDWRGRFVKPGSLVIYSVRSGSSTAHNLARVDEVISVPRPYREHIKDEKAKATVIDSSDLHTKVPRNVTLTTSNLTVIGD